MGVRIYLAGKVAIEVDGEIVVEERQFRGKQGRLVFAYMAAERATPATRDQLAELLWSDEMPESWDISLNAVVSRSSHSSPSTPSGRTACR